MKTSPLAHDRYALYEAAVQGVDFDLGFCERVYRSVRGRPFRRLREDFCGTAALASGWVMRHPDAEAWGVDRDPEPLAWARRERLSRLGRGRASRVHLVRGDVRRVGPPRVPRVDVTIALNFSFMVFKRRSDLRQYFVATRRGLARGGLFMMNVFGGLEAEIEIVDAKRVAPSQAVDGLRLPGFRYEWDQEAFNPVTHEVRCSIHFELPGGRRMRRAFTYDWRLWSLPELQEVLLESGFREARVYVEGWDSKAREGNGVYRLTTTFENQAAWLTYVVGIV